MSENNFADAFDPDNFVLGGFLEGRRGRIDKALFVTNDYNGTVDPPAHGLEVQITRLSDEEGNEDEEDGTRTEFYGIGAARITEDGQGFTGTLRKSSRLSLFLNALKAAKFPFKEISGGISGLDGTLFRWKHVPIPKSDNDKAIPAEYLGGNAAAQAQEDADFEEMLTGIVQSVVKDGPVKKAQLSARVGAALNGHPSKTKGLTKVMSDTFLSSIEGIEVEAGTVRLAE